MIEMHANKHEVKPSFWSQDFLISLQADFLVSLQADQYKKIDSKGQFKGNEAGHTSSWFYRKAASEKNFSEISDWWPIDVNQKAKNAIALSDQRFVLRPQ